MSLVETIEHRGGRVEIHYDEGGAFNPRDDYSNLSRLVVAPNTRYLDPNEIDFPFGAEDDDWSEDHPTGRKEDEGLGTWAERVMREELDVLYIAKLYRLEHGNVAYSVSDFGDPWDSGQVGWAVVTKQSAEEIGTSPEDFAEVVAAEVQDYSAWANGEIYRYEAYAPNGEEIDSMGGYLGFDSWDDLKSEAKGHIDDWIEEDEQRRAAKQEELERRIEDQQADAMEQLIHG